MRRVVAPAVVALVAALGAAGTAGAHVDVLPRELTRDEAAELTIRVPNERADAATTRIRVQIPRRVTVFAVGPTPPGWTATAIRGVDGRLATLVFTGGRIAPDRYADFTVLGTPFAAGRAVWPVNQTYGDGVTKPWTGPPEASGAQGAESGPARPGPAASQTILEPGEAPATGSAGGGTAAGGGTDDGDSGAAIWLGVIAIAISALAMLATGFLWSTRPAALPADDPDGDGAP